MTVHKSLHPSPPVRWCLYRHRTSPRLQSPSRALQHQQPRCRRAVKRTCRAHTEGAHAPATVHPPQAERGAFASTGSAASAAASLQLWCWQWDDENWRGSFFFFSASLCFFAASSAACFEAVVSSPAANTALVLCPYALGALLYAAGAACYKACALRELAGARRAHKDRRHPACEWARVGVRGCATIVTGTQLGVVSCSAPLLLAALPTAAGLPTPEPVLALEAWLTCALNVVAGIFFVVGSYVILGASYRALAPNLVFVRAHMRDLPFWGSTCYLVGSASMLMGAIVTQPLLPLPGVLISAWLGHFVGYVVGSLWFVVGAWAHIAAVAQQGLREC